MSGHVLFSHPLHTYIVGHPGASYPTKDMAIWWGRGQASRWEQFGSPINSNHYNTRMSVLWLPDKVSNWNPALALQLSLDDDKTILVKHILGWMKHSSIGALQNCLDSLKWKCSRRSWQCFSSSLSGPYMSDREFAKLGIRSTSFKN